MNKRRNAEEIVQRMQENLRAHVAKVDSLSNRLQEEIQTQVAKLYRHIGQFQEIAKEQSNMLQDQAEAILSILSESESELTFTNAENKVQILHKQRDEVKQSCEELENKLKELQRKNLDLQEKFEHTKRTSGWKRKEVEERQTNLNISNVSSSKTSPESSPESIVAAGAHDTDLVSPVKRLKLEMNESPDKKTTELSPQTTKGLTRRYNKMEVLKESNASKENTFCWMKPVHAPSNEKIAEIKIAKDPVKESVQDPIKKIESPRKVRRSKIFDFSNKLDSSSTDSFKKQNAQNNVVNSMLALKLKVKPKIDVAEKNELNNITLGATEPFFVKEEPLSQDVASEFLNNPISQELFSDSNSSVMFVDPEPNEIPIFSIPDSENSISPDKFAHLKSRKLNLEKCESFFKNNAKQIRDVYEGECEKCKKYYDERALQIDIESANLEVIDCESSCKGFRLRVQGVRMKPGYVDTYQILRANRRLPINKNNKETSPTSQGFWNLNVSLIQNQHMKPGKR